ncbi:DUF2507 domain-containing protein [Brevibacillus reuszeri]|uniref:DUF2507 domain-containing protein n=1 Tax=Brevibacillus reuszeri TaxID=54915 RepID=UPI003D1C5B5D
MKEKDQLAALLPAQTILYAERMSMPYLGYHLLRETLTNALLGDSESPILYWLGKEIGRQIHIQSEAGIIHPFMRLGLGQLDLVTSSDAETTYKLSHSIYQYQSAERLCRTLSLEAGIIAGALETWRQTEVVAKLEIDTSHTIQIIARSKK